MLAFKKILQRDKVNIKLFILLIAFITACSVSADPKQKLVDEYMEAMKINNTLKSFSSSYTLEAKRLYKDLPESFWTNDEYKKLIFDYEKALWEGWRAAYHKYLTEEELKELLQFLQTDLGKKFLRMQVEMEPIFTKVASNSAAILNDEFTLLIKSYGY
ncbi:MAG: DUF2059 domain-containing protein [Proteobacteria bacterium]|nr:DUF2059 domain-containing protein [Pseudomonadota bacterium]NOG61294.1 DUF2059 domain-containing protein [Pseudomonadota bacterium]